MGANVTLDRVLELVLGDDWFAVVPCFFELEFGVSSFVLHKRRHTEFQLKVPVVATITTTSAPQVTKSSGTLARSNWASWCRPHRTKEYNARNNERGSAARK